MPQTTAQDRAFAVEALSSLEDAARSARRAIEDGLVVPSWQLEDFALVCGWVLTGETNYDEPERVVRAHREISDWTRRLEEARRDR